MVLIFSGNFEMGRLNNFPDTEHWHEIELRFKRGEHYSNRSNRMLLGVNMCSIGSVPTLFKTAPTSNLKLGVKGFGL